MLLMLMPSFSGREGVPACQYHLASYQYHQIYTNTKSIPEQTQYPNRLYSNMNIKIKINMEPKCLREIEHLTTATKEASSRRAKNRELRTRGQHSKPSTQSRPLADQALTTPNNPVTAPYGTNLSQTHPPTRPTAPTLKRNQPLPPTQAPERAQTQALQGIQASRVYT